MYLPVSNLGPKIISGIKLQTKIHLNTFINEKRSFEYRYK